MKHLTTTENLDKNLVQELFTIADQLQNQPNNTDKPLKDKTIALLFFENSTRTLVSFELAAKKLGAHVINVNISKSSAQKGESLKDTILTIQAMGVDAFIVRHGENYVCEKIKQWLNPKAALINAGDGNNQHPSQTLLDFYTLKQNFEQLKGLKVSILGDIRHSRVASSFIQLGKTLELDSISIFGPKELMIEENAFVTQAKSFEQAIEQKDAIMMLRIQKERINNIDSINFDDYNTQFGLKKQHLKLLKPTAIILHPGPFNRGVEIDSEVINNPKVKILDQVKNGVFIRQAILIKLLAHQD